MAPRPYEQRRDITPRGVEAERPGDLVGGALCSHGPRRVSCSAGAASPNAAAGLRTAPRPPAPATWIPTDSTTQEPLAFGRCGIGLARPSKGGGSAAPPTSRRARGSRARKAEFGALRHKPDGPRGRKAKFCVIRHRKAARLMSKLAKLGFPALHPPLPYAVSGKTWLLPSAHDRREPCPACRKGRHGRCGAGPTPHPPATLSEREPARPRDEAKGHS